MNALLEITETVTRRTRLRITRADEGSNVMAIHTGLSVTVCGHLIQLDRDDVTKIAQVVVSVINGHHVTGLEQEAVKTAADLLLRRAQRFLGGGWTVVGWKLPKKVLDLRQYGNPN